MYASVIRTDIKILFLTLSIRPPLTDPDSDDIYEQYDMHIILLVDCITNPTFPPPHQVPIV